MVKKAVYVVLLIAITGLGAALGFYLVNSNLIAFVTNLPYQFKLGLIGLTTLIGLIAGILLASPIMTGAVRLTVFLEQHLQKTPTQDLVMGSVGLIIGLIIANLIGSLLSFLGLIGKILWVLLTLLLAYLGLSIGIKKREDLMSLFANFPKFGGIERQSPTGAIPIIKSWIPVLLSTDG